MHGLGHVAVRMQASHAHNCVQKDPLGEGPGCDLQVTPAVLPHQPSECIELHCWC